VGQAYQVQPFQNRLLRLTVKGSVLQDALEQCVAGQDHLPDCHIAGAEVWYDPRKAAGKRISRVRVAGKDIDNNHPTPWSSATSWRRVARDSACWSARREKTSTSSMSTL